MFIWGCPQQTWIWRCKSYWIGSSLERWTSFGCMCMRHIQYWRIKYVVTFSEPFLDSRNGLSNFRFCLSCSHGSQNSKLVLHFSVALFLSSINHFFRFDITFCFFSSLYWWIVAHRSQWAWLVSYLEFLIEYLDFHFRYLE